MIQTAMTTIGKERGWENTVFVSAYQEVIDSLAVRKVYFLAK